MKSLNLFISVVLAIAITGCGAPSIKVDRDANSAKKVAIVSVFSNSALYNIGGGGGLTALASFVAKKTGAESVWGGTRLVSIGLDSFSNELGKSGGMTIVSGDTIINAQGYKDFVTDYTGNERKYGRFMKHAYSAYPGMVAVNMGVRPNRNVVPRLGELAKALNVDAVAIVQLDLAYEAYTAFAGMGSAKAKVAANLCIVDQDGKIIVSTPWDVTQGKGIRHDSTDKAKLVAGELIYNSATERMFKEAIDKNAAYFREQLAAK